MGCRQDRSVAEALAAVGPAMETPVARPISDRADRSGLDEGAFKGRRPPPKTDSGVAFFWNWGFDSAEQGGGAFRAHALRETEGRAQNGSRFPPPPKPVRPAHFSGGGSQVLATLRPPGGPRRVEPLTGVVSPVTKC